MKISLFIFILFTLSYSNQFDEINQTQLSQKNRNEVSLLKQQVAELTERLDGITTLIEGFNSVIDELKQPQNRTLLEQSQMRLSVLEAKVTLLSKGTLSELPELNSDENKTETKEEIPLPALSIIPSSKLYSQGVRLFLKHKYDDAKERFTITKDKNYKPAASNYYLGEIAYTTKNYEDAILYFKKSVELYDEANYNDLLLLHTAISLEKIGDANQAKLFYEMIIESYPDKKTAITAKENLDKL